VQADDGSTSSSLNRFLKDSHKARRVHTFNYVDGPHIGKKTSEVSRTSNPNAPERTELPSAMDEKKGAKICASCAEIKESMQRCTRCKAAYYCNATCQLAHWQVHKQPCLAAAQLSGAAAAAAGNGKKSELAARALTHKNPYAISSFQAYTKSQSRMRDLSYVSRLRGTSRSFEEPQLQVLT